MQNQEEIKDPKPLKNSSKKVVKKEEEFINNKNYELYFKYCKTLTSRVS